MEKLPRTGAPWWQTLSADTGIVAKPWFRAALVAALSLIGYWGVWNYGFASDDVAFVGRLAEDGAGAMHAFLSPQTGATGSNGYFAYYRPVQILLTALDYLFWGTGTAGYHLTNLVMFALAAVLVWQLVRLVSGNEEAALWSGTLFALHPIHTLNAIWISGRTDGGATLGVLAALCAFVLWRKTGRRGWLIAAAAGAVFGLGSKEMAYTLPMLAWATEWMRLRMAGEKRTLIRSFRNSLPMWFVTAFWAGFVLTQGTFVSSFGWRVPLSQTLSNIAGALGLLALPFGYEELVPVFLGSPVLLVGASVIVLLGVAAAAWIFKKNGALLWGVLWMALAVLPLYRVTMRWYLLLPSVGFCIAFGALVAEGARLRGRVVRIVGMIALLAYAGGLVGERLKWEQAEQVNRSALASLVALAEQTPPGGTVTLTTTPAKVARMPVFGGNTERFLRLALLERGVPVDSLPRVRVLAMADLASPEATPEVAWADGHTVRVTLPPGKGSFVLPHNFLNSGGRRRQGVGDEFALGTALEAYPAQPDSGRVVAVDEYGRPASLEFRVRHRGAEVRGNLVGGWFVHQGTATQSEAPQTHPADH